MNILNLVLYSENEPAYVAMREVLREHTTRYPNVRCVFYLYDSTITEPWILDGDTLRIRGTETFIPGILQKTLDAFRITSGWDYDLLIRTNISTVVDFTRLLNHCDKLEFGGPRDIITWRDFKSNVIDPRFQLMPFICGWCMIFSQSAISLINEEVHKIDTSVIDDVSISEFLIRTKELHVTDIWHISIRDTTEYNPTKCVFRNYTPGDRMADVERMREIVSRIQP